MLGTGPELEEGNAPWFFFRSICRVELRGCCSWLVRYCRYGVDYHWCAVFLSPVLCCCCCCLLPILTASVAARDVFWSSLSPVHAHCVLSSQALLRTYGNTMIMGTVSYPDSPCFALAARRGVITTTQHFTLLGVNTWRWPSGVPYSFDASPEVCGARGCSATELEENCDGEFCGELCEGFRFCVW